MADPAPEQSKPPEPAKPEPTAMAEAALAAAQAALNSLDDTSDPLAAGAVPFTPTQFKEAAAESLPKGIDLLSDVNLNVKIELGRTRMLVEDVLKLGEGSVVELDKLAGDPVDVFVNERHIARGEVLVLNDKFCVRVNEIIQQSGDGDPKAA